MSKYLKSDLTIISEPRDVKIHCPCCSSETEIDYKWFSKSMSSFHWEDWKGELVYCEECKNYFEINSVIYD